MWIHDNASVLQIHNSLEVLGMDLHVLDGGRDRHHYTLPCLHSLSMRCHSVFAVPFASPWLCVLRRTAHSTFSPLAQSLSFTLHFPPICFHLTALSFSTPLLSLSPLTATFLIAVSHLTLPPSPPLPLSCLISGRDGSAGQLFRPVSLIKLKHTC